MKFNLVFVATRIDQLFAQHGGLRSTADHSQKSKIAIIRKDLFQNREIAFMPPRHAHHKRLIVQLGNVGFGIPHANRIHFRWQFGQPISSWVDAS